MKRSENGFLRPYGNKSEENAIFQIKKRILFKAISYCEIKILKENDKIKKSPAFLVYKKLFNSANNEQINEWIF